MSEQDEVMYGENMEQVQDWGDGPPLNVWYRVRVDKVKTHDANGQQLLSDMSGEPKCQINFKIQDEPCAGQVVVIQPSLQAHALFALKALYSACEYHLGPSGHNFHKVEGCELYIKPTEKMYNGEKRIDVKPFHMK